MLRIYRDQIDHFTALTKARFRRVVLEDVCEHYSDLVTDLDDRQLVEVIDRGVTLADEVGVDLEPEALQLVVVLLALRRSGAVARDLSTLAEWVRAPLAQPNAAAGKVRDLVRACAELPDRATRELVRSVTMEDVCDDLGVSWSEPEEI